MVFCCGFDARCDLVVVVAVFLGLGLWVGML